MLTTCVLVIGVIFVLIGALGYTLLGAEVETVIFLNLPTTPGVLGLQLLYAVAIMLSFPLTVYPVIRITEQGLFGQRHGKGNERVKWQKNAYRAGLVLLLGATAWLGSANLDKVVSLVGCLACIPLSFILPPLFHSRVTRSPWVRAKDLALVLLGLLVMAFTSYVTLDQWARGAVSVPRNRCAGGGPGPRVVI